MVQGPGLVVHQRQGARQGLPPALDLEGELVPGEAGPEGPGPVPVGPHRSTGGAHDPVPLPEVHAGRGGALVDGAHAQTLLRRVESQAGPPPPHLPAGLEVGEYGAQHVDRDREAEALAGRVDHGVDPDHAALHVEQGATGVARVDAGVGLQEVVVGAQLQVPVLGRDDARGHRVVVAVGVAHREHGIAGADRAVGSQLHRGQARGRDGQQGQIAEGVDPDHGGVQDGAVHEPHADGARLADHVVVGDDQAVGIHHQARSQAGPLAGPERGAEEAPGADGPGRVQVDHRGGHPLHPIRQGRLRGRRAEPRRRHGDHHHHADVSHHPSSIGGLPLPRR